MDDTRILIDQFLSIILRADGAVLIEVLTKDAPIYVSVRRSECWALAGAFTMLGNNWKDAPPQ